MSDDETTEEVKNGEAAAPKVKNSELGMKLFAQYRAKKEQLELAKKSIEAISAECNAIAERIATEANVTAFKHNGIEYAVGRVGKQKTYTVKRKSATECVEF